MIQIKDVVRYLEAIAPPAYQEDYDNAGLIVGNAEAEVTGVLTCLDSTEAVLAEARELGCNLVVAHHPIVFRGLKRLTGRTYVERVVLEAIRHDIAIYAIHTNLDNVYHNGVNARIAEQLGLVHTRILAPKAVWKKLAVALPADDGETLAEALREAAGPGSEVLRQRERVDVLYPGPRQGEVLRRLRELAPGAAHTISAVENEHAEVGSGLIGELAAPVDEHVFLHHVRQVMQAGCIRHTPLLDRPVRRVAVCGGAGGFLLGRAIGAGADMFITADYKYHEFFDADGRIVIADIGHFESEQYTADLLFQLITEKFSTFAVRRTQVNTNPVRYF